MSFPGGTPVTGPRSLPGGVLQWLVPGLFPRGCTPLLDGMGYPHPEMRYPLPGMRYHPGEAWGIPPDRTAYGVLDTRQAVCLLRSHRGTFLLHLFFHLLDKNLGMLAIFWFQIKCYFSNLLSRVPPINFEIVFEWQCVRLLSLHWLRAIAELGRFDVKIGSVTAAVKNSRV